jgi:hypothetical protein
MPDLKTIYWPLKATGSPQKQRGNSICSLTSARPRRKGTSEAESGAERTQRLLSRVAPVVAAPPARRPVRRTRRSLARARGGTPPTSRQHAPAARRGAPRGLGPCPGRAAAADGAPGRGARGAVQTARGGAAHPGATHCVSLGGGILLSGRRAIGSAYGGVLGNRNRPRPGSAAEGAPKERSRSPVRPGPGACPAPSPSPFPAPSFICIAVGLTLMAGLMSGLTLGLMSMDVVDLEVGAARVARGLLNGTQSGAPARLSIKTDCGADPAMR